ncbi:hypothetical protein TGAM01_v202104 [Trichoderma gamsii]|uniref:Uncharacterized protein n=1 Tax=Trichoderma gamsii TaxID=398673 RepID=A0A2P4ZXJ7_9HYPO|nr:hypothetical protein TGAM01_v202104 [Trichoderma gamsii]PON28996.1 hypothetical protein TGAM01_v202104 [Trichoderma gamsii]
MSRSSSIKVNTKKRVGVLLEMLRTRHGRADLMTILSNTRASLIPLLFVTLKSNQPTNKLARKWQQSCILLLSDNDMSRTKILLNEFIPHHLLNPRFSQWPWEIRVVELVGFNSRCNARFVHGNGLHLVKIQDPEVCSSSKEVVVNVGWRSSIYGLLKSLNLPTKKIF